MNSFHVYNNYVKDVNIFDNLSKDTAVFYHYQVQTWFTALTTFSPAINTNWLTYTFKVLFTIHSQVHQF